MTVQLDCRFLALWRSGSEAAFFSPAIAAPERPWERSCSSSVGLPRLFWLLPPPLFDLMARISFPAPTLGRPRFFRTFVGRDAPFVAGSNRSQNDCRVASKSARARAP